eukprot:TRINITY_DN510_c1_g1_i1.p1 TRINITY_DN510_c1_g1~~TRINITY_DN510_c1_g1_i1.p1  ORF type:complete len:410 (+),score=169.18 TRINITY_DN510_c1_g1_i1:50-1279(+)
MAAPAESKSVSLFRAFLRLRTEHPTPDYESAVSFLRERAEDYGLQFQRLEFHPGKPIALLTWEGSDPSLPSVLLNSHTDVVPVDRSKWRYDPFEAVKEENGDIYARGTQDMKSVCIQHIEAVGKLKASGFVPRRTVHISYVPDEEIGGVLGMADWVQRDEFRRLNVAVAIDEGLASPTDAFTVFYGERCAWWINIRATGNTGHGSRFVENTATEKLLRVVSKILQFRKDQFDELQRGIAQCGMKLGDVTTANLTVLKAGMSADGGKTFSYNVVPSEAMAGFDIRIPPTVDLVAFKRQLDEWVGAEQGVSWDFQAGEHYVNPVSDTSSDSYWWGVFKGALDAQSLKLEPEIFPAATDSRYIRDLGIPAFGFSPINNTPILLHDHNEFINERTFERGIDILVAVVRALASA